MPSRRYVSTRWPPQNATSLLQGWTAPRSHHLLPADTCSPQQQDTGGETHRSTMEIPSLAFQHRSHGGRDGQAPADICAFLACRWISLALAEPALPGGQRHTGGLTKKIKRVEVTSIRYLATRKTYLKGICSAGTPTDLTLQCVAPTEDKEPFSLALHQQKPPSCLQGKCKNLFCITRESFFGIFFLFVFFFFLTFKYNSRWKYRSLSCIPSSRMGICCAPSCGRQRQGTAAPFRTCHPSPHAAEAPAPSSADKGRARGPASLGNVLFALN